MDKNLEKIDAKKSLGQHFLNNSRIPVLMAEAGEVQKGDTVLEIGPGTGVLTRELLARGARVVAIETDHRAIESLQEPFKTEIANKTLVILDADVRDFPDFSRGTLEKSGKSSIDLKKLGIASNKYKIVANIPYYLSGRLFRIFLETKIQPSYLVFLVQKEVAFRIARDTKESLLSLSIKVFGEPRYVKTVPRGNFNPMPKVDSAIIAISNISRKNFETAHKDLFFKLIHAGFASKRKQLLGNLLSLGTREEMTDVFHMLDIPLTIRAEDLPLEKWLLLTQKLKQNPTHLTT